MARIGLRSASGGPYRSLRRYERAGIRDSIPYSLPVIGLLAFLGVVLTILVIASLDIFARDGIGIYVRNVWDTARDLYGGLSAIYGSLVVSLLAVMIAMPLSISSAVFVNEFAPKRVKAFLVNLGDLMASFPTIIYGFWGLYTLAPILKGWIMDPLYEHLGFIPIFSTKPIGTSYFTASLVLAVMIAPFASSMIREAYAMVPRSVKEGVYALGLGKWEVVKVSLGYIKGAIAGGFALAFGRGIGETVAVALTIGGVLNIGPSIFSPGYTIPALIVNMFPSAYFPSLQSSALFALALLLFAIGLSIILAGRLLMKRWAR